MYKIHLFLPSHQPNTFERKYPSLIFIKAFFLLLAMLGIEFVNSECGFAFPIFKFIQADSSESLNLLKVLKYAGRYLIMSEEDREYIPVDDFDDGTEGKKKTFKVFVLKGTIFVILSDLLFKERAQFTMISFKSISGQYCKIYFQ